MCSTQEMHVRTRPIQQATSQLCSHGTSMRCSGHCVWPRLLAQISILVSTEGKAEVAERGQVSTVCPWGQAVCSATFPSLPWLLCVGLNWFNQEHHQRLPVVHESFCTVLLDCVWTHRQVTSSGTGSSEVCDKVRHKPDVNEPLLWPVLSCGHVGQRFPCFLTFYRNLENLNFHVKSPKF